MTEKEKLNNFQYTKDDENILKNSIEKNGENDIKARKSKNVRNSAKPKTIRGSIKKDEKDNNNNTKKVKFNENVDFINVECWKMYNIEQTADENFEAFFIDNEKDDKENLNKEEEKNNNKKKNKGKDETISCTCIII